MLSKWTEKFSDAKQKIQVFAKQLSNGYLQNFNICNSKKRQNATISFKREINILNSYVEEQIDFLYMYDPLNLCLVYEFASNHALEETLFVDSKAIKLDWDMRIRIAFGNIISCGLEYLHNFVKGNPTFHRDVKSANILLNADFILTIFALFTSLWNTGLPLSKLCKYSNPHVSNTKRNKKSHIPI
jgi:serine/threonine protein kinase